MRSTSCWVGEVSRREGKERPGRRVPCSRETERSLLGGSKRAERNLVVNRSSAHRPARSRRSWKGRKLSRRRPCLELDPLFPLGPPLQKRRTASTTNASDRSRPPGSDIRLFFYRREDEEREKEGASSCASFPSSSSQRSLIKLPSDRRVFSCWETEMSSASASGIGRCS